MIQQSHFAVYIQKISQHDLRESGIPMSNAGLFKVVKRWKQPKCLSADK